MLKAGLGISTAIDPGQAASEAAEQALERADLYPAGAALVLASAAYGRGIERLVDVLADRLGVDSMVGATVEGLVAPGVEISDFPAVAVLALGGLEIEPFVVAELGADAGRAGREIRAAIGEPTAEDLVVLLADPMSLAATDLVTGLRDHLGPATVVGGSAGPIPRGPALQWRGDELVEEAVSGLAIRLPSPASVVIARTCRAVLGPLPVTRSRERWIVGIDGRPALQVLEEAGAKLGQTDRTLAAERLVVGIERNAGGSQSGARQTGSEAPVLARAIVGIDEARGAFAVPEPVVPGTLLTLMELDPATARQSLEDGINFNAAAGTPGFGFYFNCRARGAAVFGEPGVEAMQLANAFAETPIIGGTGGFQLAPVEQGGDPQLLSYIGALTLAYRD